MSLEAQIEGVLFYMSEPMTVSALAKICAATPDAVEGALTTLAASLAGRGLVLVREGDQVSLMTGPDLAIVIEQIRKEELKRDIGKAGAETLAIVAYYGSVSRAEIDFIRGVNSTFILRNLMVRGLVERAPHPQDQRSFVYRPTIALYAHLGITKKEELPHYAEMMEEIAAYRMREEKQEPESATA